MVATAESAASQVLTGTLSRSRKVSSRSASVSAVTGTSTVASCDPAIHWFTYEQVKTFLNRLGYVVATRLDLVETSDLRGWKAAARPMLRLLRQVGVFRRLYYLYSRDVSVYAIKRSTA